MWSHTAQPPQTAVHSAGLDRNTPDTSCRARGRHDGVTRSQTHEPRTHTGEPSLRCRKVHTVRSCELKAMCTGGVSPSQECETGGGPALPRAEARHGRQRSGAAARVGPQWKWSGSSDTRPSCQLAVSNAPWGRLEGKPTSHRVASPAICPTQCSCRLGWVRELST
eukprot:scaffold144457_cov184-Phaeocystis_antarctica.AAC.1